MKLNLHVDQTLSAKVRNKHYPVLVAGKGIPCLVIGAGTLMQRTLSPRFKTHFQVYSTDLYWDERYKLENPSSLAMPQIIDDIAELARSLKLNSFLLFGHSAFGIVALEFAKKYSSFLKGIVMVGTPLNSNREVAAYNNSIFEKHADSHRQKIDSERRKQFSKENSTFLNYSQKFLREYTWRDAPRYWHNPAFNCSPLWEGIILNEVLNHFFEDILPKTDVKIDLEKIQCPIFLAAGMSDYDCCPWTWSEIENMPPKLTISRFYKSGHYPNYEEEDLFDEQIETWMKSWKNTPASSPITH